MKIKISILAGIFILTSIRLLAQIDYFWVGGQGNWSNLNNWRTVTGSIPNEVPDANDNVIFNEYSFPESGDTVFVLTGNPTCKNLIWENLNPLDTIYLYGGSGTTTFSIYGSVKFDPHMVNAYTGKIKFMSDSPGNTITCAGVPFAGDIHFAGNGEWILQDTLLVFDTVVPIQNWVNFFNPDSMGVYKDPINPLNPLIFHDNGTFNSNDKVIVCRGFFSSTSKQRDLNILNSKLYIFGAWTVSGQGLSLEASNSYFRFRDGTMNNFAGNVLTYRDADFLPPDGVMQNQNIKTIFRKVHFLGSGTVDGKKIPGQIGTFKIDTLLMEGAITMAGPIPCEVNGVYNDIHYTQINLVMGYLSNNLSDFHRIDLNGYWESKFDGDQSQVDSIFFNNAKGDFVGNHTVNYLLFFNTEGVVSNGSIIGSYNAIEHAVFSADGHISGNNTFTLLSFNSGYWYQFQSDSLSQPGSGYNKAYVQTIHGIEVMGDCSHGLSYLSSDYKGVYAWINYLGGSVNTEYLSVRDIANMGTLFDIQNGIDLGHNQKFNFTNPIVSRDLYWVGGDGTWTDNTHWSLTSGGAPGDQCPPTILDNIFFDGNSGFADSGEMVLVDQKYVCFNDMTWSDDVMNLPMLEGPDTSSMRIWGSLKLSTSMAYDFWGKLYFESEHDADYETINVTYTWPPDNTGVKSWDMLNQTIFYGDSGKWELTSKYYNNMDTLFLRMGELKMVNDTLEVYSFSSTDTLRRGLYMLDTTLAVVHAYQQNGWELCGYGMTQDPPKFMFDAGRSTILILGDAGAPPPIIGPAGRCNMRTFQNDTIVQYYNVQFDSAGFWFPSGTDKCKLLNDALVHFHLVDYYCRFGDAYGALCHIDTLTYNEEATGCKIRNNYTIDFLYAKSFDDTIMGNQVIDTAFFSDEGSLSGTHQIGYLKADKFLHIDSISLNTIDTCELLGNAEILGQNTFSQLILTPNQRYSFQREISGKKEYLQTINDDLFLNGLCDGPIRINSDLIGTPAHILYKKAQPTYPDFTANYASIRDITMDNGIGVPYTAINSVNLGNNSNWDFQNSGNSTYYWIGGAGDWSDWQHWSYVSGGQPITDQCTPKEINTVIFDDNSFITQNDTVTDTIRNSYCKNMYWKMSDSYNPTFLSNDTAAVMYIYGSLELKQNMTYSYIGKLLFDQFEEPGDHPDSITSAGQLIPGPVYFQGLDDLVYLKDDMTLSDGGGNYFTVYFLHGGLVLNGNHLTVNSFLSGNKNQRALDLTDSKVSLYRVDGYSWYIDADNLELYADKSTIYNEAPQDSLITINGININYYDFVLNGGQEVLSNRFNMPSYNVVTINGDASQIAGNFTADSVLLNGQTDGMYNHSNTNVVILDGFQCSVNDFHNINRCIVNKYGIVFGDNYFKYCIFNDDGVFYGHNVFDTLILYPGEGNEQNLGNWFYFQADSVQTIMDSLYLRGNQCSNINLTSISPPKDAFIEKVNGTNDVICDFLNIIDVGAIGNISFYAGINSTADTNNLPPGWIFNNAQGYDYGFSGITERFCLGDQLVLDASNFNGDAYTQYFWEGSDKPGELTYTVNQPGTYQIKVRYSSECTLSDYIVVEADYPPIAAIDPGPFCEGDPINVTVSPSGTNYQYNWFNLENTSSIEAQVNYTGDINVEITDLTNGCKVTPMQNILVKPAPTPDVTLGPDITIKFGESITLDAGPGDSYSWSADPLVPIPDPNAQTITVPGYSDPNPITYSVEVTKAGCVGDGEKVVGMYPPSKLGIPTAFTPNGSGPIKNEVLHVKGSGFKELIFRIYDRYGKLVFETNDKSIGWDGTTNGVPQPEEVYTYYCKVLYQDGGTAEETGNITLLR